MQAVKRNIARFPEDFMFQLAASEWAALRSQFVTLKTGRGQHRKYQPYAFTEQGVAMLSSVLRGDRAIAVNVQIMRAFVRMQSSSPQTQPWPASSTSWNASTNTMTRRSPPFSPPSELMDPPEPKRRPIGFTANIE